MQFVAIICCLMIFQYIYFMVMVGQARGKYGVQAPAVSGDENFERILRVQLNTLEQLIVAIPMLWVCAYFCHPNVAAAAGVFFLIGRTLYSNTYRNDPKTRGLGMIITFGANIVLTLGGLIGAIFLYAG